MEDIIWNNSRKNHLWKKKKEKKSVHRIYKDTTVASLEALDQSPIDFAHLFRVLCLAFRPSHNYLIQLYPWRAPRQVDLNGNGATTVPALCFLHFK